MLSFNVNLFWTLKCTLSLVVVDAHYSRCTFLYDTLRPKLIHETNLDVLCELVDILKVEVLGEQLSRRGESLAGLRPTLDRVLADVHERLTFRARTHIRDEVSICFCISIIFLADMGWNINMPPMNRVVLVTCVVSRFCYVLFFLRKNSTSFASVLIC